MFRNFLVVGIGGAAGAMLRYGMTVLGALLHWSGNLPTFIVNVVGSFAMGLLMGGCQQGSWQLMATVGICGGFTTFSTFSMQSVTLMQAGKYGQAAVYVFGTLVACFVIAAAGYWIGQKLK